MCRALCLAAFSKSAIIIFLFAGFLTGSGARADMVADPDMVTKWNIIGASIPGAGPNTIHGRAMAMMHSAIFDSVNAINPKYHFFLVNLAPPYPASPEAATAQAAHDVLVSVFPAQQANLDAQLANSLATIPDGTAKTNGIAFGQQVAAQVIQIRSTDHSGDTVPYSEGLLPGGYRFTPGCTAIITPQYTIVTPWTLTSNSQFRVDPPPDVSGSQFQADLNEVKSLGQNTSTTRTPNQTDIARFWAESPVASMNRIARIILNGGGSLVDNARLFALINVAIADAGVALWDSKFTYNFWRPVTAINFYEPNLIWNSLLAAPCHPEYPSAHAGFSGSALQVLSNYFGDQNSFSYQSTSSGTTHSFSSFSQALNEVADSRVYAGIHYRTSVNQGKALGRNVGNQVFNTAMLPLIPFAAFSAKVDVSTASSTFDVSSSFTLGSGGSISPRTQDVIFQLVGFAVKIPAGSFQEQKTGNFVFEGAINGVLLEAKISPLGSGSYSFKIEGAGAANLPNGNPVTVRLTIGNDTGTISATADFQ